MRREVRLAIAVGSVFLFLLLSLLGLSWYQTSRQLREPASQTAPIAPEPGRIEEILTDLEVEVESLLLRSGISLEDIETNLESNRLSFRVRGDFPPESLVDNLRKRLERDPDIRVLVAPQQKEIQVVWRELAGCLVQFVTPVPPPAPPPVPAPESAPKAVAPPAAERKPAPVRRSGGGKVAIIMDDMGRDLKSIRSLLGIDIGVTVAVLPWEENSSRVATLAAAGGREVIIHLPMEPKGYPSVSPGKNALLNNLAAGELRNKVEEYIARVPHAVGGNNHMGSSLTENRVVMAELAGLMKEKGLFFVDSRTSPRSVAFGEMRKAGVASAGRDVFLDNVQNVELISRQIRKLVKLANHRGQAVGICHPHPETLAALRREVSYIRDQGVTVVPVSELLTR